MDNSNITLPLVELQQRVKTLLPKLPLIAGNEIVNFSLDNFRRQGFQGATFQPWRKRKNPTKWGQSPKRNGRNVLMDSGRLRRSVRVVRSNSEYVVVGSDVPYAKAHNDGFSGHVVQLVEPYKRKQTYAGVASKFKVNGLQYATGSNFSIKSKKQLKNTHVSAITEVKEHMRVFIQRIPKRQYIGNSPYLNSRLQRTVGAEIMRAFKP